MKLIKDISDNVGYYYVDEEMNINDLVVLVSYGVITLAIIIVAIIEYYRNEYLKLLITGIVYIGFSIPFAVHLLGKLIKVISFKLKRKRIMNKGMMYRGTIVDSIKGKKLFKDKLTYTEKYAYYPVVEVYIKGAFCRFTSKSEVSNGHRRALANENVTVHLYKDDFILTDAVEKISD